MRTKVTLLMVNVKSCTLDNCPKDCDSSFESFHFAQDVGENVPTCMEMTFFGPPSAGLVF